jgi:hypothetical protein
MRHLQIDLNRRSPEGHSPASYVGVTPVIGEPVVVFEPEDEVEADGVIAQVNVDRCAVLVAVDWDSLRDRRLSPCELMAHLGVSVRSATYSGTFSVSPVSRSELLNA